MGCNSMLARHQGEGRRELVERLSPRRKKPWLRHVSSNDLGISGVSDHPVDSADIDAVVVFFCLFWRIGARQAHLDLHKIA
jgi:hypothetical protein